MAWAGASFWIDENKVSDYRGAKINKNQVVKTNGGDFI
jgi:hypothetical protein